jgi:hypothetical protein
LIRPSLLRARWRLFARSLSRSTKPILCGPWRSEFGFEILYWMPFLAKFAHDYGISRERLVYLGRGGSAHLFESAGRGDILEHMTLPQLRALSVQASQQTGSVKQQTVEPWERSVCDLAMNSVGLPEYHVLSPQWMYRLCAPFWEGRESLSFLDRYLLHQVKMPAPAIPKALEAKLPESFIAMRWYSRPTWPLKEPLVLWTRKLVEAVSQHTPVILIDSGFQTDDHGDINLGSIPNVVRLSELQPMLPTNSLHMQSAVIARADGYVGTYGGMAQGAMRWGIPTLALYETFGQTSPMHLHLTQSLSLQSGTPFVATYPQSLDVLLPLLQRKVVSQ